MKNQPTTYNLQPTTYNLQPTTYIWLIRRFIPVLLTMFFFNDGLKSQGCQLINNHDLNLISTAGPGGQNSFQRLWVDHWFSSHNSPHHIMYNPASFNCSNNWTLPSEANKNCVAAYRNAQSTYNEGIFTNVDVIKSSYYTYEIGIEAEIIKCVNWNSNAMEHGSFELALTNGLTHDPNNTTNNLNAVRQVIFNENVTSLNSHTAYTASLSQADLLSNYSQLWIYSIAPDTIGESVLSFRNVSVTCTTSALTGINHTTFDPSGCGLTLTFNPILDHNDCARGDETYIWTVNGVPFSTDKDPNYTFPNEGQYEVCLDYTDCNGCCAQACQIVKVESCEKPCPVPLGYIELDATNGKTITQLFPFISSNTFANSNFVLTGELIIDQDIVISSCHFLMNAGAKITVQNQKNLSITSNTLFEGCDVMWDGIYYEGAGTKKFHLVEFSEFRDAQNALHVTGNAQMAVYGNTFSTNTIGISTQDASMPLLYCYGNEFTQDQKMLLPFDGQDMLLYDEISFAGILGIHTSRLLVDGGFGSNHFHDMKNGIVTDHTNLECKYNVFNNMVGNINSSQYYLITGRGIGMYNLLYESNVQDNVMNGGSSGISARNINFSNLRVQGNDIDNFTNAIDLDRSYGGSILIKENPRNIISDNYLDNINGIYGSNIRPYILNISDNKFRSEITGISLGSSGNIFGTSIIENNLFEDRMKLYSNSNVGVGVLFSNVVKTKIFQNIFDYGGTNFSLSNTGIKLQNSNYCAIQENLFFENSAVGANIGWGIYAPISNTSLIECNEIHNFSSGMSFINQNNFSQVRTNIFNASGFDISLFNSTIGPQPYHGNLFVGTSFGGLFLGSQPTPNQFTYNNNNPPPFNSVAWSPTNYNPSGIGPDWFVSDPNGNNQSCAAWPQPRTAPLISYLEDIVMGDVINNAYYDQNLWTAQWQLLEYLDLNDTLLAQSSVLDSFYYANGSVHQYLDVQRQIDDVLSLSSTEFAVYQNWHDAYNDKIVEIDALLAIINDQNYASYSSQLGQKYAELDGIITEIKGLIDNKYDEINLEANLLKNQVSSLAEPLYFCDEFKTLYHIQLDEIIEGEAYVAANYTSDLITIASKCEYDLGKPVYIARSFCDRLGLAYTINDCTVPEPRSISNVSNEGHVNIYPNPTNAVLNIESKMPINQIRINNHLGQVIKVWTPSDASIQSINIGDLAGGIYIIEVRVGEQIITKKVIKI